MTETALEPGRSLSAWARLSSRVRVLLFGATLAIAGVAMLWATPMANTSGNGQWILPLLGLLVAFAVAESTALHVEIRRESHSLSLSSIPMMFGLFYVSPVLLALAYVAGSVPIILWIRKSDPIKALWNSTLFFAEAALAALVVRSVLGIGFPDGAVEWLVPLGAVLLAELLSLLAVPLVIMTVDAKFRPDLFADVGRSQILAVLAGTFTVTAVSASVADPLLVAYTIVPLVGIGSLLRSTGRLSQRYTDLQQIHGFTRALANERGARTIDAGLASLVEIMRCRSAYLLTVANESDERPSTLRGVVNDTFVNLDAGEFTDALVALIPPGTMADLTIDDERHEVRELLEVFGATRLIGMRVMHEADRVGALFITDRLGMRSEFTTDELRMFGSLVDNFSARLSNDHLVTQLETQAQHDALTGLPNRLNYEIALTSTLANPDRRGVVLMIDLDRFKEINDSLGHEMGDRLLIEIAARLQRLTRASDVVARFGGDEFAVMLTHEATDGSVDFTGRIDQIHDQLTATVELDGITFEVGASIGVTAWPAEIADAQNLLRQADIAMYEAKRNQLGAVWYSPELDADEPRRLELYMSARAALDHGDMFIHLQPKVSTVDGRITGAEALVRWNHSTLGPVSPLEFVPLLDQAGLSGKLTRFVVEQAAAAIIELRAFSIDIPIAVNLTSRDLLDARLPHDICAILSDAGVEPKFLQIEITEDAMVVDFETSIGVLNQIRDLGVTVSIDDFGTGYSSLQHLHRLPVDALKIDRSFIGRLAHDESARAIVRASINLARDLGLRSIAEGIEDERGLERLAGLGCDEVQGFLLSRSLPCADFVTWVQQWEPASLHPWSVRDVVGAADIATTHVLGDSMRTLDEELPATQSVRSS